MILCPRCQTAWPEKTLFCYKCGSRMSGQAPVTPRPGIAVTSAFAPSSAMGERASIEAGWAEFSGTQAPMGQTYPPMPVAPGVYGSVGNYPPMPVAPGTYGPAGGYPSYAPGMPPPMITPTPQKQGMSLGVMLLLGLLASLLIFGGVFVGVHIGQARQGTVQKQAQTRAQTTSNPDQLYQQVTSHAPTFTDTLLDGATSSWGTFDKPTYGCTIHSDGLHVHIQDLQHFTYCVSDLGNFSNLAFQVQMKILSGDGGGLILRSNATGDNLYYFHIYPNGDYHIYKGQNHQLSAPLSNGSASSFISDQRNTVTAIAQGNQLYFYINQKFLTMVQDSAYTSGDIGVASASSTTAADVVYTNAKIWRL